LVAVAVVLASEKVGDDARILARVDGGHLADDSGLFPGPDNGRLSLENEAALDASKSSVLDTQTPLPILPGDIADVEGPCQGLPVGCEGVEDGQTSTRVDGTDDAPAGDPPSGAVGRDSPLPAPHLRAPIGDGPGPSPCAPFPASECTRERQIANCESGNGTNPRAYDARAANAGRLQISRAVWKDYFERNYGVSWEQITFDDQTNRWAGWIVWQRAGDSWSAWACNR